MQAGNAPIKPKSTQGASATLPGNRGDAAVVDLTAATISRPFCAPRINGENTERALKLLGSSAVRTELLERIHEIRQGEVRAPSAKVDFGAVFSSTQMGQGALITAMTRLFREATTYHTPLPRLELLYSASPNEPTEPLEITRANARSLLERGVFPADEVREHVQSLGLYLLDPQFDLLRTLLPAGVAVAVVLTNNVAPWWGTVAVGAFGLLLCSGFATRMSVRNEYAAGYQLELLNAHEILDSGRLPLLGDTLNRLFNNEGDPKNYGNLLRVEGFLAARTLRVLGHSQSKIFDIFRDSPSSHAQGDLLSRTLARTLNTHEIEAPNYLFPSFTTEKMAGVQDEDLRSLIESMDQVHFEWALIERNAIRERFAEIVREEAAKVST